MMVEIGKNFEEDGKGLLKWRDAPFKAPFCDASHTAQTKRIAQRNPGTSVSRPGGLAGKCRISSLVITEVMEVEADWLSGSPCPKLSLPAVSVSINSNPMERLRKPLMQLHRRAGAHVA